MSGRACKLNVRRLTWSHALLVLVPLLVLVAPAPLTAQLPLARLWSVFPAGGQNGSTVEVTIGGADLDEVDQLRFDVPALTASPKTNAATGMPEPNRFVVTIASNMPPGFAEVRAVGRFGISNPRTFAVDTLPESVPPATNRTPATACLLPVNTTINGRTAAGAADFHRFHASRGTRFLIDCLAREIDSRLDPVLFLFDAAGLELNRSRSGDPIDFTAPVDGDYTVKLHDRLFRGGDDYFYRLAIISRPHVVAALPAGTNRLALLGQLLPGGTPDTNQTIGGIPLELLEIEAPTPPESSQLANLPGLVRFLSPASAAVEGFLFPAPVTGSPMPVFTGPLPVTPEREPNNTATDSQPISLPAEITGQFHPARDVDCYNFEAKKGEVWWIEVASHRLGRPTDPAAAVQRVTRDARGVESFATVLEVPDAETNAGGVEFNTASRDPIGRFEVKEDGAYRLILRDLFGGIKADPRNLYRLSIRRETPDFRLVVLPVAPPPANRDAKIAEAWTALLRRAETIPLRVLALRRDGFTGPIDLVPENLPPGVTAGPARVEANATSATVLLTAADDAPRWAGPLRLIGKAQVAEQQISRAALGGTVLWTVGDYNNEPVQSRCTAEPFLAVSDAETAPVSVAPAESKPWTAVAGSKPRLQLQVTRRGDFTETLKLKATGLAPLDPLKEVEVDAKTNAVTVEIDLAQIKLEPGTHTFHFTGQTKGKYRNNPEAADRAKEKLKGLEQETTTAAAEAKQAAETLEAARKTGNTDLAALEASSRAAADKAKEAEIRKTSAADEAKRADERAKPREVLYTVYSRPIQLVIQPPETK